MFSKKTTTPKTKRKRSLCRSSRLEEKKKKDVLGNFAKFTGKHPCQSLFFNKIAGLQLYLKKRLWQRCFLVNCEISKNNYSYRTPLVAVSECK